MKHILSAEDELLALRDRNALAYRAAIDELIAATILGPSSRLTLAKAELANVQAGTSGIADLLGRRRALLEADAARAKHGIVTPKPPPSRLPPVDLPKSGVGGTDTPLKPVAFREAVEDIVTREPRLAKSAAEVSRMYANGHVFAAAKAGVEESSRLIVGKVQSIIAEAVASGGQTVEAVDLIDKVTGWGRNYSDIVFKNAVGQSYTNGRFAAMRDPAVADIMLGFQVVGPVDSDTRANHAAYFQDGGIHGPADHPMWKVHRPMWGHRCRHTLRLVDRYEAERNGWVDSAGKLKASAIPAGAHPDKGFQAGGGSPFFPRG